jgi:hypothetical protein
MLHTDQSSVQTNLNLVCFRQLRSVQHLLIARVRLQNANARGTQHGLLVCHMLPNDLF